MGKQGSKEPSKHLGGIQSRVPVEAADQVWHVARVLSCQWEKLVLMYRVSQKKAVKSKIFEKMQF